MTRFGYVTAGIMPHEHPCGCDWSGHALAKGVMFYALSSSRASEDDLCECRQCGAVWRNCDALDFYRRIEGES